MRLQSLLAYLVLHRDVPQQRQRLAFLFWPDTTEAQARNNLRQLLYQLRLAFPATGMQTLYWHSIVSFHLDVAEFEQAIAQAEDSAQGNDRQALSTALEQADHLYRGELLPACYDEWILTERERLQRWQGRTHL